MFFNLNISGPMLLLFLGGCSPVNGTVRCRSIRFSFLSVSKKFNLNDEELGADSPSSQTSSAHSARLLSGICFDGAGEEVRPV